MQFKGSVTFVFAALAAVASAATNAFSYPLGGETFAVNQTISITWADPAGATITLSLLSGSSDNLNTVQVIGSGVSNQGIVAWTIPDGLVTGLYALSIVDDDNSELNYSGQFTIIGAPNVTTTSSSSSSSSSSILSSSSEVLSTTALNTTTSSVLVPSSVTNSSQAVTSGASRSAAASGSASSGSASRAGSSASRTVSASSTSTVSSNAAVAVNLGSNALGALALALL